MDKLSFRPRRRKRRIITTIVAAGVVLAVAGLAIFVLRSGESPLPINLPFLKKPSPSPTPEFSFKLKDVRAYRFGRGGSARAARRAARGVREALSNFYGSVFFDPDTWENGPPDDAFEAFAGRARTEARRDEASFSLGAISPSVASLAPARSVLRVSVLFDPFGHVQAATARVFVSARGTTKDGALFRLRNTAAYLLRPGSDGWIVFGYPSVTTRISKPKPTAGASPTGAPSP